MTVADRPPVTNAQVSIASRLAPLIAIANERGGRSALITTTQPIGAIDPIDLFAAGRALGFETALWLEPSTDRSIVGIGRAWAIEPGGPERFAAAADAWRALLADAIGSGATADVPEAGPILLGGLGFTGRPPDADDPWASFGPASLVLPTFAVARRGGSSCLTVATRATATAHPDLAGLEQRWTGVAREAAALGSARIAAATHGVPDTRGRETGRLRAVDERPDRADWDRIVGLFAGAVGRGRIDKVVLARRVVFEATADLDVGDALRHLARTAPESTTFAFVRDGTTFLGATPERLVRTAGRSFETVAMAGSAARGMDPTEDARLAAALLASEKDREEHAVVVDMIRSSLAPIVETMQVAYAPSVLPLHHLQHLVTPVTGTTRDEAGLLALVGQLHPTPAVGGAPRDLALALIQQHEAFDRGWYAGPIGWLGADGDGEMMVALRCGLVTGSGATLFAGCGIVADSDPAREWEESRLKMRTMIAALGGVAERDR